MCGDFIFCIPPFRCVRFHLGRILRRTDDNLVSNFFSPVYSRAVDHQNLAPFSSQTSADPLSGVQERNQQSLDGLPRQPPLLQSSAVGMQPLAPRLGVSLSFHADCAEAMMLIQI